MKLVDLDPKWVRHHGAGRIIGVSFLCPHCAATGYRIAVGFENPPDGGPPDDGWVTHWQRTGETFDTLTLSPSIDVSKSGHWHGWIRNGEVT